MPNKRARNKTWLGGYTSVAASILSLASTVSVAAPVLDQSYDPAISTYGYRGLQVGRQSVESAQTFTVGKTGRLVRVDVKVGIEPVSVDNATGDLLLDIRPVAESGIPITDNGSALLTVKVPASQIEGRCCYEGFYQFVEVDLGAGLPVTAGDVLAIVLRSEYPNDYYHNQFAWSITSSFNDEYSGGRAFSRCFLSQTACVSQSWEAYTSYLSETPSAGFKTYVENATKQVLIDVKPGSEQNTINPGSMGLIPVAILGAADFSVADIDLATARLSGASVASGKTSFCSTRDVNRDGNLDLLCNFPTQQMTDLSTGEVVFSAQTHSGDRLLGSDTVRVVPPENDL